MQQIIMYHASTLYFGKQEEMKAIVLECISLLGLP